MIFIERWVERAPMPPSLDPENSESAGQREFLWAFDAYKTGCAKPKGGKPKDENPVCAMPTGDDFTAYKDDERVRETLSELFHGKCAYCESKISGSSQTDVEHYRPKGKIRGRSDHPGYWWLAMRWENLVLSCMHCNQSRRQLPLSPDMTVKEIEQAIRARKLQTMGKANFFPVQNDHYARGPDDALSTERPLLIDPTVTDPEPLFDWTERGDFALMRSKTGDPRADRTIATLGLNRRWLCEQRMTVMADLLLDRRLLDELVQEIAEAADEGEAQSAQRALVALLERIRMKCGDERPHAAIARKFLTQAREALQSALEVSA